MVSRVVSSWGSVVRGEHAIHELRSRHDCLPDSGATGILPYGNGRSYGDSCLNIGGALLQTRHADRFMHFDPETGVLACEAGVLLADILRLAVPSGWFVPVLPGTSYVTVGGAIANDVHGKNHHGAGTFGRHVRQLELLRSDGTRLSCSPQQGTQWFNATVGGLGLTGVITWAELQLRRIPGHSMNVETIRFRNLKEFFDLCEQAERSFEYTVSWIDCLGRGKHLGRGLLQRANHAADPVARLTAGAGRNRRMIVPFVPPVSFVNKVSLRVFNTLYYHRHGSRLVCAVLPAPKFFFPLDGIRNWNRLYGPRGFFQYQCVIPAANGPAATTSLLRTIAGSGLGSFLAVLKRFGATPSPGLLSFPREGVTLALDFPNTGADVEKLFRELDAIVAASGGRLYPAKDCRMPGSLFRSGYPRWREFSQFVDPAFSSSFWRRVTENA